MGDNRTKVTVFNEDDIPIDSEDIEMKPFDSIKFLINTIAVQILGCNSIDSMFTINNINFLLISHSKVFIVSGTTHWIYNYMDGLDWYLLETNYFNFHIFFMSLSIWCFGIGL